MQIQIEWKKKDESSMQTDTAFDLKLATLKHLCGWKTIVAHCKQIATSICFHPAHKDAAMAALPASELTALTTRGVSAPFSC